MSDFDWTEAGTNLLNTSLSVWAAREGAKLNTGIGIAPAQQAAVAGGTEYETRTSYEGTMAGAPGPIVPWYQSKMVMGGGLVLLVGLGFVAMRKKS